MFVSRGARLFLQPSVQNAHAFSRNLHSAGLARICGLLALFVVATMARASYMYTQYPEDICAVESIYLDGTEAYTQGVTGSGIGYTVALAQGQNAYSGRYSSFNPQHATVTVRFDKPMAAVGAVLTVSGYSSYMPSASDQDGLYLSESGYRGVVADGGSIQEVTFTTDNGPMSALRIDVRPLPVAANDKVQMFENSDKIYDSGTLLKNDQFADGAILVEAPLHAEKFQLNDDGTFTYKPVKNFEGIDSFTYRATNGLGASHSQPATVDITVTHVNCAPEFVKGQDVTCNEDDGAQTIANWATQITAGSDQETSQTLTWQVTADQPGLFSQQPALGQDGTLTFQPALYQSGVATVSVRLHDDGGLDNGGVDTSAEQTFTITIQPRAHAPMIEPIMDCAVKAGDALVLQVKSTEVDSGTALSYSLDQAPDGASIDSLTGQILWRPLDAQSGEMPKFVVRATRAGDDAMSSTTSFHVEVLQNARPPELSPIPDMEVTVGNEAITKVSSKRSGQMRYFLATTIPGAMLNPTSGDFHWKPANADAGKTVSFSVTAVDLSNPNLCALQTFTVHVDQRAIALHKPVNKTKSQALQTWGEAAMRFAPIKAKQKAKITG